MSPSSIVQQVSTPLILKGHRGRIRGTEGPSPGQWVYVLPISPASSPPDLVPGDPLAPSFQNGCTNVAGSQAVSFRIHPATRVALRGAVDLHGATLPVVVFTLPDGFRPAFVTPIVFPSTDGVSIFSGRIDPSGDVVLIQQFT